MKNVKRDSKEIGMIGESIIYQLAAYSGITATKPDNDCHGWDYLLQFTNTNPLNVFAEDEASYKIFVQVKAFDCDYAKYKGRNIKLSNMHEMNTSNEPWFFLFVDINSKDVYIVHAGEDFIEEGLRKVLEAKIQGVELNSKTLKVNPHNRETLKISQGGSLKDALLHYIETSQSIYSKQKMLFREKVGKKGIKVNGSISYSELISFILGNNETLPINDIDFAYTRFGMEKSIKPDNLNVELISTDIAIDTSILESKKCRNIKVTIENSGSKSIPLIIFCKVTVFHLANDVHISLDSEFFKMLLIHSDSGTSMSIGFNLHKLLNKDIELGNLIHQIKTAEVIYNSKNTIFNVCGLLVETAHVQSLETEKLYAEISKYLELSKTMKWLLCFLEIEQQFKFIPEKYFKSFYDNIDKIRILKNSLENNMNNLKVQISGACDINKSLPILLALPIQIEALGEKYIITTLIACNRYTVKLDGVYVINPKLTIYSKDIVTKQSLKTMGENLKNLKLLNRNAYNFIMSTYELDSATGLELERLINN